MASGRGIGKSTTGDRVDDVPKQIDGSRIQNRGDWNARKTLTGAPQVVVSSVSLSSSLLGGRRGGQRSSRPVLFLWGSGGGGD